MLTRSDWLPTIIPTHALGVPLELRGTNRLPARPPGVSTSTRKPFAARSRAAVSRIAIRFVSSTADGRIILQFRDDGAEPDEIALCQQAGNRTEQGESRGTKAFKQFIPGSLQQIEGLVPSHGGFVVETGGLGQRLKLNELNVREGKWQPRQYDSLSNAMLINHNVWT